MSDTLDPHTLRVMLYEWQQMDACPRPDRWEALGQWIESHYAKAEAPPEAEDDVVGTALNLDRTFTQSAQDAAFLRAYAFRLLRGDAWDTPRTMASCLRQIADRIEVSVTSAEAPPETGHATARRCNGCGHEWSGAAPVILCGNCWLKCWPFVFGGVRCRLEQAEADVARLTAENAALKAKLDVTTDDFGCVPMSFSSVIDGIDSRQTQEAVENLVVWHMRRAEQADAERDAARAQVWAEAIAVVEHQREPLMAHPTLESPSVYLDMVLAALRAAQERQP